MQHKNAQNVFIITKWRPILPSNVERSSQYVFHVTQNTRRTSSIWVLQMGQPLGMFATASAQFKTSRRSANVRRGQETLRAPDHASLVGLAVVCLCLLNVWVGQGHLNTRERLMLMPKYRISVTQGITCPASR